MPSFRRLMFLLSSRFSAILLLFFHHSASAFLASSRISPEPQCGVLSGQPHTILPWQYNPSMSSFSALHAGFEQLPGENTTQFIKRITSLSSDELLENEQKPNKCSSDENDEDTKKPVGKYQRIEDWDAERTAKGELSWEEKVQFDGQRYGNQVRQDSILRRHLGTY